MEAEISEGTIAEAVTLIIDPTEHIVEILMAQAPSASAQVRFLFEDLLYAAVEN